MEKIGDIKNEYLKLKEEDYQAFIETYKGDERPGVLKLTESIKKRIDKLNAELLRLDNMLIYERKYADHSFICGIDEVGRGPLAGPVCAGAVILPKELKIPYVNDSKKVSAEKREELYDVIKEKAVASAVSFVDNKRIDEINILQATYEAMRKAIEMLDVKPDLLLNDAVTIPLVNIPQVKIIKGDAKSESIAAASIIAKVTRDRYMQEISEKYPEYNFASNKGYGSAEHIEALKKLGPCEIHRKTFIANFT